MILWECVQTVNEQSTGLGLTFLAEHSPKFSSIGEGGGGVAAQKETSHRKETKESQPTKGMGEER